MSLSYSSPCNSPPTFWQNIWSFSTFQPQQWTNKILVANATTPIKAHEPHIKLQKINNFIWAALAANTYGKTEEHEHNISMRPSEHSFWLPVWRHYNYQTENFALRLALMERLRGTRKWSIVLINFNWLLIRMTVALPFFKMNMFALQTKAKYLTTSEQLLYHSKLTWTTTKTAILSLRAVHF